MGAIQFTRSQRKAPADGGFLIHVNNRNGAKTNGVYSPPWQV
jgi:hypothetical protein